MDNEVQNHTFSILVENEAGVLARVIGLLSGRGYNIDSLTVSEIDKQNHLSKIIRSLAADAIENKKISHTSSKYQAEEFVSKICDSKIVELGSLGLGTQYKINADSHLGQTLLFHTKLI